MNMVKKRKSKEKTESLQLTAQNNVIRTNYVKAKIDNRKFSLCGEKDKTAYPAYHIANGCSELAQKESKTTHEWVGKVIHWELCKRLKFVHTNKWCKQKSESFLENESQNSLGLWDTNG